VKFDLVEIGPASPDSDATLQVPKEFMTYSAADNVKKVIVNGVEYLEFGSFGFAGSALLDANTGKVYARYYDDQLVFVNSSLGKFSECVKRLLQIYPFYEEGSEFEEWKAAGLRVEKIAREVDPEAYVDGESFWFDFRWDVVMGDS
jgi:hypothetical protein